MSKNLGFILSVLFGVVCFIAGTYYSWMNLEKEYIKYTEKWDKINADVEQFVEVSNPKTIRFYVSELRKILDDMTRLSKIIEKGQDVDEALKRIEGGLTILEQQWDLALSNDLKMKETIEVVNNHIKDVDIRSKSQIQKQRTKWPSCLERTLLPESRKFDQSTRRLAEPLSEGHFLE